ncbi:TPA: restriction endonuclease subunit S [Pluralibacter gergoviae]|nr:restriction endonuclease subunit S [Pluralibacter gergoviae]EMD1659004.1 restriction endonuclease subunit S [Pluralibacter gergoviae]HDS1081863.1 restriction endonuclease subunit S [Pluralibacter gergoviae]
MSEMSYLEKLLDGAEVEWLPLGDISEIYGGLTGKTKSDFGGGNARYISYKSIFSCVDINQMPVDTVKIGESESQHRVRYGDVLFTGSSEIAEEAGMSSSITTEFDEPVYLNSFSFGVRFNEGVNIIPEFSKYLFRTNFMRAEISKTASGVTRFNISKARFRKILIPIISPGNPEKSLAIQAEIVRILDTFTALTAELTAELTARKKQYNYYREQSLSFNEGAVEWKMLGEMGTLIRGKRFVKADIIPKGVPCIHYGEMYTHYSIWANRAKSYISVELASKLRKASCGDVVFVSAGETIADIGRGTAWLGDEDVVIHDACFFYKSSLNPKYVAYFSRTNFFHDQIKKSISSGKISAINAKGFEKVIIPVPSPEEQARIVAFLDKFDTLTSSITEGLPREIELRQKQYEYYRDLLFSFPKPDSVTN